MKSPKRREGGMMAANPDAEVQQHRATDPHYPLGEPDAMKWAVAFRQMHGGKMVEWLAPEDEGARLPARFPLIDDGLLVAWFANCMATGEMLATGGSFLNADAVQSILDGEMEAHPEFGR
jgi:hypothetical protein